MPRTVASRAVRSYRTLSPLPAHCVSAVLRRYTLCCTCRRLTPPRCYLAPCPMEPGLSSLLINQNGDCLAGSERSLRIVICAGKVYPIQRLF